MKSRDEIITKWQKLKEDFGIHIRSINSLNLEEKLDFIDFFTLNEVLPSQKTGIGQREREFFRKSYDMLIDNDFSFETMTPCWRAGN